jgi:hypothetical protein
MIDRHAGMQATAVASSGSSGAGSSAEASSAADTLLIAGAQLAPVWLDRDATIAKVVAAIRRTSDGTALLAFPEAFVTGYPFWIEWTDGARFDDPVQKALHSHFLAPAVQIEAGHLDDVCAAARAATRWCWGSSSGPRTAAGTASIEHRRVREARQNFDSAGHYGRPDVLHLHVNRTRQQSVRFSD